MVCVRYCGAWCVVWCGVVGSKGRQSMVAELAAGLGWRGGVEDREVVSVLLIFFFREGQGIPE